jgi:23S rRNA pseudouridine955/2504/2580 synthase
MPERPQFVERVAGPDDAGRRLDKVLRAFLGDVPLSALYRAMRRGRILVNGSHADASYRVASGDLLSFEPGLVSAGLSDRPMWTESPPPEDGLSLLGDLLVLATTDLLFLNKPRGMLSHGDGSLEAIVRAALSDTRRASLSFSPGPLHRLDRNTSGLIAFPRSAEGARSFTAIVRERRIAKYYLALVEGHLEEAETWEDRIERDYSQRRSSTGQYGREASSVARPLAFAHDRSLILVQLQTGLTHQIRVQAASRGHPLAGDTKYGGGSFSGGYILHAFALRFAEPPFPDLPAQVEAPLPPSARNRLDSIFGARSLEKFLESSLEA